MDLLDEIKRLKLRRADRNAVSLGPVENPLPRWEKAWAEVSEMVQVHCINKGVTFAELIEECRGLDAGIVTEFYRLWDLVDCDVFGWWVDNRLTEQALEAFYSDVERWKEAVHDLLALHEEETKMAIQR